MNQPLSTEKEFSDSASKIFNRNFNNEVSEIISMPLTERERNLDNLQRSSKERRSSYRKKSKDVWSCRRHPNKRIKYFCETDHHYMCSLCKKEHKGQQHTITQFKIDTKMMKQEIKTIINDYHSKANNLLGVLNNLRCELRDKNSKISSEIEKFFITFNKNFEELSRRKLKFIDDLKLQISSNYYKINDINSYEDFIKMKSTSEKELSQLEITVESCMKVWSNSAPMLQEIFNFWERIGAFIAEEYERSEKHEYAIKAWKQNIGKLGSKFSSKELSVSGLSSLVWSSLQKDHVFSQNHLESVNMNLKGNRNERDEYTHLNWNDRTDASTHLNSEYGALQMNDKRNRRKFPYKNQTNQNKVQNRDSSIINQLLSENSSMNISTMPQNKNNSAIVIWNNKEDEQLINQDLHHIDSSKLNIQTTKR